MAGANYEVRIQGGLVQSLRSAFAPMIATEIPGETTTVLTGQLRDQAELSGLLRHLEDLGFELLEVRRQPVAPPDGG